MGVLSRLVMIMMVRGFGIEARSAVIVIDLRVNLRAESYIFLGIEIKLETTFRVGLFGALRAILNVDSSIHTCLRLLLAAKRLYSPSSGLPVRLPACHPFKPPLDRHCCTYPLPCVE